MPSSNTRKSTDDLSPVFALDQALVFPHPVLAEPDGLLAVGGSLSIDRLLLAYRWGIFPWFNDDQPVLWWWTSPRLVLKPRDVHVSHSLKNLLKKKTYSVTFNQHFHKVINACKCIPRKGQAGTWIVEEMVDAYTALHDAGYAHSVEVFEEGELTGGLYGIILGKIFYGESMFAHKPNASKVGFIHLCDRLQQMGIEWIDCQQDTPHMRTMGGKLISGKSFLEILRENHRYMLMSSPI